MSYINNALKKAQREKDGRYVAYGGIVSQEEKIQGRSGSGGWKYAAVMTVIVIVAAGVVVLRIYPDLGERREPPVKSSYRKPAAPPLFSGQSITMRPKESGQGENKNVQPGTGISSNDKKKPETAEMIKKALLTQKKGHLDEAESLYRKILQISPGNAQALNNLGVIYLGRKDENQAIRFFDRAIIAGKSKADPYYNLACVFARRGDTIRSLQYLKRAVTVDPGVKEWAREDGDLKNLKPIEEFRKLIDLKVDGKEEMQTGSSGEPPLTSPASESRSFMNMEKK